MEKVPRGDILGPHLHTWGETLCVYWAEKVAVLKFDAIKRGQVTVSERKCRTLSPRSEVEPEQVLDNCQGVCMAPKRMELPPVEAREKILLGKRLKHDGTSDVCDGESIPD